MKIVTGETAAIEELITIVERMYARMYILSGKDEEIERAILRCREIYSKEE